MGLYQIFETDAELEKKGFALEYGDAVFIIARAGGANESYQRFVEHKMRPHRTSVNAGTMAESTSRKILIEAYSEKIILAWDGVTDENDEPLEFSKENVVKVLTDLPDLFEDIVRESSRVSNYIAEQAEADAKG